MEELILLLLQLLGEILLEILVQVGFSSSADHLTQRDTSKPFRYTLAIVGGAVLGWLSLGWFPQSLLTYSQWQLGNLVLAPFLSAELAAFLARRRRANDPSIEPAFQFWQAGLFTGALVLTRYLGLHSEWLCESVRFC